MNYFSNFNFSKLLPLFYIYLFKFVRKMTTSRKKLKTLQKFGKNFLFENLLIFFSKFKPSKTVILWSKVIEIIQTIGGMQRRHTPKNTVRSCFLHVSCTFKPSDHFWKLLNWSQSLFFPFTHYWGVRKSKIFRKWATVVQVKWKKNKKMKSSQLVTQPMSYGKPYFDVYLFVRTSAHAHLHAYSHKQTNWMKCKKW